MSSKTEARVTAVATVSAVRDMEELEGTLLPVATAVSERGPGNGAIPAITQAFDYDEAISNEQQQQLAEEEFNEAFPIPDNANQRNFAGVSDDSKTAVGKADLIGKIRCEEELEIIRNNRRKIHSRNYFEANAYKSANERAKQRDREGLEVKDDRIGLSFAKNTLPEKVETSTEKYANNSETASKSGYHVKEYECMTYDTNEYSVSEYKSIYD